jgi:hypothetical protein
MAHIFAQRDSQKGREGSSLLVPSVRRVVQQVLAHLGELDEQGRVAARALARQVIGVPEQKSTTALPSATGAARLPNVLDLFRTTQRFVGRV